jgi:hypothetical protein
MYKSLLLYGICLVQWNLVSSINSNIFKYQNKKWIINNMNILNNILVTSLILFEKYNNIESLPNAIYYYIIVAYYIYDIKRHYIFSIFWMHHALSNFIIILVQNETENIDIYRNIFLLFELGNLPLYLVYGMKTSIYKSYWEKSIWLKIFMVIEFIWYTFFRCILPIIYISKIPILYKLFLIFFISASAKWSIGIYNNLIKEFTKDFQIEKSELSIGFFPL